MSLSNQLSNDCTTQRLFPSGRELNDPHVQLIRAIRILFGNRPFTIEQVAQELTEEIDVIAKLIDDLYNDQFICSKIIADNITGYYFRSDSEVGPILAKMFK